jgi:hypothetical protein
LLVFYGQKDYISLTLFERTTFELKSIDLDGIACISIPQEQWVNQRSNTYSLSILKGIGPVTTEIFLRDVKYRK